MFRLPTSIRTSSRSGLTSAVALGLSLSAGALVATAALSAPALAQKQKKPGYSKNFVKVYQPVADIVNAEGGDFAAAKAQLPGVLAAAENDDDKNAAGNLTLILGNKLSDPVLQRQGLQMMVDSGKVAPEQLGQFQYFLGNLAYAAKDYDAARAALKASLASGYVQDNTQGLILESYFAEGKNQDAVAYLSEMAAASANGGQKLGQEWYLRGLQKTYDNKDVAGATTVSQLLLKAYPTPENWQKSLQVVYSLGQYEPQAMIDVLRLMRLTDALKERREYVSYIQAADERIMANEVLGVLSEGAAKGVLDPKDNFYLDVKRVADTRAPADKRDVAGLAAEGRKASAGGPAYNAAEVYFSLGQYADAEALYSLALQKGVEDQNRVLTRLGITQVRQGKMAEADATFAKVGGNRVPIAKMWQTYIATKG